MVYIRIRDGATPIYELFRVLGLQAVQNFAFWVGGGGFRQSYPNEGSGLEQDSKP